MSHVAILLATKNGADFLPAQLESLERQSHPDWSLWVSDDGSEDATREILDDFAGRYGSERVHLFEGPGRGPTRNFLSLIGRIECEAQAYAFCDQDDVWLRDRLSRGLGHLNGTGSRPTLVGHRTHIVTEDLTPRGLSPLFTSPPGFLNALVQSIAGGNTMLMNRAARDLIRAAGTDLDVVTHDWWAYQIVSGAGGSVIYDPEPTILYRQHATNLIGANDSFAARLLRIRALFQARFHEWNSRNIAALDQCRDLLTPDARRHLDAFVDIRGRRGIQAIAALRRSGLYRQTRLGTFSLYVAAALGKL